MQNTPKQPNNAPKTKESIQAEQKPSAHENAPKVQSKSTAQVKTKEAYIKSQKADMSEKSADTVKTKANYIKQHKTAEVKDGIKQKPTEIAPKTRENTAVSSAPTPKTKEQIIKDARKKYVSEKLKTKAEAEKSARQNHTSDMAIHNGNLPKTNAELIKSDISTPNVNSENMLDASLKEIGVRDVKFHTTRHTFATRALEIGMDIKTLSEILGHASPTVTLNIYAHSLPEHKAKEMDRLGKMYNPS